MSYCGPQCDEIGSILPPSTTCPVCTNPGQLRLKQPVDLYESLCTTIHQSKIKPMFDLFLRILSDK